MGFQTDAFLLVDISESRFWLVPSDIILKTFLKIDCIEFHSGQIWKWIRCGRFGRFRGGHKRGQNTSWTWTDDIEFIFWKSIKSGKTAWKYSVWTRIIGHFQDRFSELKFRSMNFWKKSKIFRTFLVQKLWQGYAEDNFRFHYQCRRSIRRWK